MTRQSLQGCFCAFECLPRKDENLVEETWCWIYAQRAGIASALLRAVRQKTDMRSDVCDAARGPSAQRRRQPAAISMAPSLGVELLPRSTVKALPAASPCNRHEQRWCEA